VPAWRFGKILKLDDNFLAIERNNVIDARFLSSKNIVHKIRAHTIVIPLPLIVLNSRA
jgi:hypothetical protein